MNRILQYIAKMDYSFIQKQTDNYGTKITIVDF